MHIAPQHHIAIYNRIHLTTHCMAMQIRNIIKLKLNEITMVSNIIEVTKYYGFCFVDRNFFFVSQTFDLKLLRGCTVMLIGPKNNSY